MDLSKLRDALLTAMGEIGRWELSFFGENGMSVERVCAVAALPRRQVRVSTVGRLRSGGFDVRRDPPPLLHLGLTFDEEPDTSEVAKLIARFDPPILRPAGGRLGS